jgi:hypothetical protein
MADSYLWDTYTPQPPQPYWGVTPSPSWDSWNQTPETLPYNDVWTILPSTTNNNSATQQQQPYNQTKEYYDRLFTQQQQMQQPDYSLQIAQMNQQNQQAQLAAQQQYWAQQLAAEQQQRLAQLAANPVSWLEYAAQANQPPVVQQWMKPLMPQDYQNVGVGQPIPGWTATDMKGMPDLLNPSAQLWSRMGPTAQAQYQGYQKADQGMPLDESQFRLWSQAPSGNSLTGLRQYK